MTSQLGKPLGQFSSFQRIFRLLVRDLNDSLDHSSLADFTPEYTRRLDDNQTECEDEGNPEVVARVPIILSFLSGTMPAIFILQRWWKVTSAMEPAELFGVVLFTVIPHADDGVVLEVIHARDKDHPEENKEEVELVVKLEEIIVKQNSVTRENLSNVTATPAQYRHGGTRLARILITDSRTPVQASFSYQDKTAMRDMIRFH